MGFQKTVRPRVWLGFSQSDKSVTRRLRVSAAHNEWNHIGIAIAALEEGFFAAEGFGDIELMTFDNGGEEIKCEHLLFERFRQDGIPIAIIRPRHIYGPENYDYRGEGFFFDRLMRDRPILVPGDGSTLTQFGYVEDIADAFRLAIEREEASGQAYTVTGKECVTFDTYVDLLGQIREEAAKNLF